MLHAPFGAGSCLGKGNGFILTLLSYISLFEWSHHGSKCRSSHDSPSLSDLYKESRKPQIALQISSQSLFAVDSAPIAQGCPIKYSQWIHLLKLVLSSCNVPLDLPSPGAKPWRQMSCSGLALGCNTGTDTRAFLSLPISFADSPLSTTCFMVLTKCTGLPALNLPHGRLLFTSLVHKNIMQALFQIT